MTITCRIQWIDKEGKPTPDSNPAIGYVQTVARNCYIAPDPPEQLALLEHGLREGHVVHQAASEWFPICADHARELWRLSGWTFDPLP